MFCCIMVLLKGRVLYMTEIFDFIVIGAGPAGLSAAINARIRGKSVLLISGDYRQSGLYKAPVIDNYLGLESISGADFLKRCLEQAKNHGIEPVPGKVLSVMPFGGQFLVGYDSSFATGRCVILATGVVRTNLFPGEAEFLGRGLSYCATCDGMLYRGKSVCVIGLYDGAEKEAAYLEEIGCSVRYIPRRDAVQVKILGEENVSGLEVSGKQFACSGVFILRSSISPVTFLPDLRLEDGHIKVDKNMQTSVPGIFAAGDCVGKPYQINKAAGDGQKAALLAAELWLK